jgi:leucyl/phenylalanyl-tRNA--protein transferase
MEFTADDLLECYRRGVFPMAETRSDQDFYLVDPPQRGILPLDAFHVPKRLARTVRAGRYEVRVDTAFADVVAACAQPGKGRTETWISLPIERMYGDLFALGSAHSVECWKGGALVGGLYGVSIGGAFFGESMFSKARDASKVALIHLVARLIVGGYRLLDSQFINDHLTQFGVQEISRDDYQQRLARALTADGDFYGADGDGAAAGGLDCGTDVLQAISQAS